MPMQRKGRKKPAQLSIGKIMNIAHKKMVFLLIAVLLVLLILSLNLGYISASSGENYSKVVLNSRNYASKTIPYRRGTITDINGETLAVSEKVYYVILDCSVLNDDKVDEEARNETVMALVSCFGDQGITEEMIRTYLTEQPDNAYIRLLSEQTAEQIAPFQEKQNAEDSKIIGVWFEDAYKRLYPQGELTSHVVGYTIKSEVGQWGVEAAYDAQLVGSNGRTYGYLNSDDYLETTTKEATDGNTVVMSLNAGAQRIIRKHVIAFNEEHRDEAHDGPGSLDTSVLVMDPNTGAIIAMYNYPEFNPNDYTNLLASGLYTQEQIDAMTEEERNDARSRMWTNYCISSTYEPGSVVKPFTVAAALESGALDGSESFYCDGGENFAAAGYYVSCHLRSGHGTLSLSGAVAQSCNDAMMQISRKTGVKNFTKYQSIFGFGKKTNIDLPGEANAAGLLFDADNMKEIDLGTNSFGQNFNVTMIQTASAFASLINGGKYYQPYVVQRIETAAGEPVSNTKPVLVKETISEKTSQMLKSYMRETMTVGTGKTANIDHYMIGAKTGTAQKLPREAENYLLSFMGYAPADNPEVLLYVVIDQPNAAQQDNSLYVTGLAKNIMTELFPYLEITSSDEQTAADDAIWQYNE